MGSLWFYSFQFSLLFVMPWALVWKLIDVVCFLSLSFSATVGPMPKLKQSAVADSNNATLPHPPLRQLHEATLVIQDQAPEGPRMNASNLTHFMPHAKHDVCCRPAPAADETLHLGLLFRGWLSWMRQNFLQCALNISHSSKTYFFILKYMHIILFINLYNI